MNPMHRQIAQIIDDRYNAQKQRGSKEMILNTIMGFINLGMLQGSVDEYYEMWKQYKAEQEGDAQK
jgi:hypothetical protein